MLVPDAGRLDLEAALGASGVLAIIRGVDARHLVKTVEVLCSRGITAMEITLDTPGALEVLPTCRALTDGFGAHLGAGTVLDATQAGRAIEAGAEFLVSPHVDIGVLQLAREAGIATLPGALTPTEIVAAWRAGAAAIKVFPISAVGGLDYLRALREPLGDIPLLPVGGIGPDDVADYLAAGAFGVGMATSLVDRRLANAQRFEEIGARVDELLARARPKLGEFDSADRARTA